MVTAATSTHPGVARGFRTYARIAAWLMALTGLLVLLGWALELRVLTAIVPGAASMKASAALAFVLAAAALWLRLRSDRQSSWLCGALSLLVLAVAGATLAAYALGSSLWLDRLFPDADSLRAGLPPGRMAQLTAVGFGVLALIGIAACWVHNRFTQALIDALALSLLAIAMTGMAAFGLQLGAGAVTRAPFNPMPIHTSVLFLLAALAWMSARPERGMTRIATADSIGGALARRLLLPSLLLPVLITYLSQLAMSQFAISDTLTRTLAAVFTGGAVATLVWWVASLLDRVERERRETQRMRDSAATDGLTGLPNRRAFDEALAGLLKGRRERDAQFCLLMLDLDNFKSYNDSFGHLAGDDALRITARLLRDALRPGDIPTRYGGEEFALLLPGSDGPQAAQIGERINQMFRQERWPQRPVTVSIGAAEAHAGDDSAGLIHRADAALYRAKHGGRDRTVLARVAELTAAG